MFEVIMKMFFQFLKSKDFFKHLGIAILTIGIVLFIIFKWLNVYTRHGETVTIPDLKGLGNVYESPVQQFKTILEGIGGKVIEFSDWSEIKSFVKEHFEANARIISTLPELAEIAELNWAENDPPY